MPYSLTAPQMNLNSMDRAELVSLGIDVRKECLKAYLGRIQARLTGPDASPVFIPQNGPHDEIYRGLVLVPHGWPKTALNP
jgi:hypothetical protein